MQNLHEQKSNNVYIRTVEFWSWMPLWGLLNVSFSFYRKIISEGLAEGLTPNVYRANPRSQVFCFLIISSFLWSTGLFTWVPFWLVNDWHINHFDLHDALVKLGRRVIFLIWHIKKNVRLREAVTNGRIVSWLVVRSYLKLALFFFCFCFFFPPCNCKIGILANWPC